MKIVVDSLQKNSFTSLIFMSPAMYSNFGFPENSLKLIASSMLGKSKVTKYPSSNNFPIK